MNGDSYVEVPDHLIVPISSDLPGNESAGAAPQAAPVEAAPADKPRFWTKDQEQALVHIFQTAKTPEEIVQRSAELGRDAGIAIPLEGPGGAKSVLAYRKAHGDVPRSFTVPNFAPDTKADPTPDGMVELPADAKVDYGTVSGLHPEEIKAKFAGQPTKEMLQRAIESAGPLGLSPLQIHGFTAGLDTEIKSILETPLNMLRGEGAGDAYHDARTDALARLDYLRMLHDDQYGKWEAPVEEISGALANPLGMEAKTLPALARVGAGYGAVSGFEDSNGSLDERLRQGTERGVEGALAAPAIGVALRVPGAALSAGKTVLSGSPNLARRIISHAIEADGKTSAEAGGEMAAAHANDVPYMLADTGDNARGLLAASVRTPGPARTIARNALEERQAGLGERVTNAIERDLGPVANPHEVADQLMTTAHTNAAPLYAAAYARPGLPEFVQRVSSILRRPSMKSALANAYRLAQEEGENPESLGFSTVKDRTTTILDSAGNAITVPEVVMENVPSWKTLDYVKRGMDDVVEGYRDKTTGRLKLDTNGRAINNTLRSFLGVFDKANPDYAAARAAYGGPVRGIDAMNAGRKALNMTADDLEARMRDMTPFEKDMFALGTRRAMAEAVQSKGDTANVINTLVGTGKKRAMLGRLFGDRQQFNRFVDTLMQEKEGFRTYARGMHGSPTALNLQDDASLELASAAVDMAANGGLPIATAIKMAWKFGAGRRGDKTKQKVAALLSETDPARFRDLAESLRVEAERRGLRFKRIGRAATAITRDLLTPTGQPAQQGQ